MPRTYIVASWNNAAAYDEGDTYSGEQIGNRNQKSIGVQIERDGDQWKAGQSMYLPNGKANTAMFAEQPKQKPKGRPLALQIDLAQSNYDRLEKMSEGLDNAYFEGDMEDPSQYELLRHKMDQRLAKAWKRLEKENAPFWDKQEANEKQQIDRNIQLENGSGFWYDVFTGLEDENIFKRMYFTVKKIWDKINENQD